MEFAYLNTTQKHFLDHIKIEKSFLSEETEIEIRRKLGTNWLVDMELRPLRNAVVRYYSNRIEKECVSADGKNWLADKMDLYEELNTRRSMVTAAIDHVMFRRGMEV